MTKIEIKVYVKGNNYINKFNQRKYDNMQGNTMIGQTCLLKCHYKYWGTISPESNYTAKRGGEGGGGCHTLLTWRHSLCQFNMWQLPKIEFVQKKIEKKPK